MYKSITYSPKVSEANTQDLESLIKDIFDPNMVSNCEVEFINTLSYFAKTTGNLVKLRKNHQRHHIEFNQRPSYKKLIKALEKCYIQAQNI